MGMPIQNLVYPPQPQYQPYSSQNIYNVANHGLFPRSYPSQQPIYPNIQAYGPISYNPYSFNSVNTNSTNTTGYNSHNSLYFQHPSQKASSNSGFYNKQK